MIKKIRTSLSKVNVQTDFIIGLPSGGHMGDATNKLLEKAGIHASGYTCFSTKRKYKTSFLLPSDNMYEAIIDKPIDLIYSLLLKKTDIIITGSDYVDDFILFHKNNQSSPFYSASKSIVSAHDQLNHLGYFGTQLAFMIRKDSVYDTIDQLISQQKEIICYSEFPLLTSLYLSKRKSYKKRFGNSLPSIVSNLSFTKHNPRVTIIYSHGTTESKGLLDKNILICDLLLSGKTYKANELKIVCRVGHPIFNKIYKRKDSKKKKEIAELVGLLENAITKHSNTYTISKK